MRKPAKRKVNKNIIEVVGAGVLGILAGAGAVLLSKKENRDKVERSVKSAINKGKQEVTKAKKVAVATKKKLLKR